MSSKSKIYKYTMQNILAVIQVFCNQLMKSFVTETFCSDDVWACSASTN